MARRIWMTLALLAHAVLVPAVALGQTESYSGGEVTGTTLDPQVLGTTLERAAAERLPNTGFQSEWLAVGGLLLILVGVSLVWFLRAQRPRSDA